MKHKYEKECDDKVREIVDDKFFNSKKVIEVSYAIRKLLFENNVTPFEEMVITNILQEQSVMLLTLKSNEED